MFHRADARLTQAPPPASVAAVPARGGFLRDVSLIGAVALVVGNMVGTSVYTLPASLAAVTGPLGIVAWGVTAAGYLFVALVYASLGGRYPRTGGPYVFAREAFGELAGFVTVWSYWVSVVIGNAAIVTSVVGYAVGFSPVLAGSVALQFVLAQSLVWALCAVNIRGVRESTRLQLGIMLVTIVPLMLILVASLGAFDRANLVPFAPQGWGSLAAGAALVVWAYSGIESATVPAEEIAAPVRTIGRATMIGYAIATVVFLLLAATVAGTLPNDVVASSARPLALAVEQSLGSWAGAIIGAAAIIAGIGVLNGWTLMAGRIPVSASRDGIFFRPLGRLHPTRGTPYVALLVGSAISSITLTLYFSRSLLAVFNFIVLLSVLLTLLPHLMAMAAELVLAHTDPARYTVRERRRARVIAPVACSFVLFTIYGVGIEVAAWGALAIALGIPFYFRFRRASSP